MEREYIGTYKVYKVFRKSRRREVIARGLTRDEAMRLTRSYPNSNTSIVVFDKQFTADKYFRDIVKYRLYHKSELIFENADIDQCYFKLQRSQSQSSDWAMKYEGWRIVRVDNKGNEHETK